MKEVQFIGQDIWYVIGGKIPYRFNSMRSVHIMNELNILNTVFSNIFDKQFTFSSFDERLEMQKAVYLMGELGASCGDYGFTWYKHGPYSQSLQNAMFGLIDPPKRLESITLSPNAEKAIKWIRETSSLSREKYDLAEWLEAIASIHYIKTYMWPTSTKRELKSHLKTLKPHLNCEADNDKAILALNDCGLIS